MLTTSNAGPVRARPYPAECPGDTFDTPAQIGTAGDFERFLAPPLTVIGCRLPRRRPCGAWPSSATRCSASTSTRRRSALLGRGRHAVLRAGARRPARAHASRPAGCGSRRRTTRPPSYGDVHFLCVGTPQQPGSNAADLGYVDAAVEDLAPLLTRPCLVVGKSTVPVGTAERLRDTAARARPGRRRRAPGLEPRVPPRGLRRQGHPAPGPPRLRRRPTRPSRRARATVYAPILDEGVPWSSPTSPPPSWSRSPPTRSSPRRSPSSTRWPRCARPPAPTSPTSPTRSATTTGSAPSSSGRARLRRRLPAQGHPRLHGPGRRARRRPGAGVPARGRRDQHAPPQPHGRPGPRAARRLVTGTRIARARRGLQAQQRRRPRLAGAERGAAPCTQGAGRAVHDPKALDNARRRAPDRTYVDDGARRCAGADVVLLLTEWQRVPRAGPGRARRARRATGTSSTAATRSTPTAGAPPAGTSRRSDARASADDLSRDPDLYGDDATAERLLRDTDVWVVAGLSQDQSRAAYGVARLLQSRGKRIVPVHPRAADRARRAGLRDRRGRRRSRSARSTWSTAS